MNNHKINVLVVMTVLLVIVAVLFAASQFKLVSSTNTQQQKTIVTNGTATLQATPDTAYINIGVIAEAKELTAAQEDASQKMNSVIAELEKLGIKKEDIKTINYSANPKYVWNQETGQSETDGYTVNNTLEVTVRDISKLGTIVDSVVVSGSNQIYGIRYDLKDKDAIYAEARTKAVKDAREKAEAFAKGLGVKNIQPIRVTEGYNSGGPIVYGAATAEMVRDAAATPITPGTMDIVVNVSVEFSYE